MGTELSGHQEKLPDSCREGGGQRIALEASQVAAVSWRKADSALPSRSRSPLSTYVIWGPAAYLVKQMFFPIPTYHSYRGAHVGLLSLMGARRPLILHSC